MNAITLWGTGAILLFSVAACGGNGPGTPGGGISNEGAEAPAPEGATAIAGTWVWFDYPTVYIDANGNLRIPGAASVGTWTCLDTTIGLYQLNWVTGFIDHLTLSADGNELSGYNQVGTYVTAARVQ